MNDNLFSPTSGAGSAPELIPTGTLSWAVITMQGAKQSGTTGGTYYPVTLTLVGGDHEGRKVFDLMPDVSDTKNGEKWRQMGITAITRIFESAGVFNAAKPETYAMFKGKEFLAIVNAMDGLRVAVKVKVEKSKDPAYADKNKVGEWLSPNPASTSGFKDYQKLIGGQQAVAQARSTAFGGAAPTAAPATGQAPGWIKTPSASSDAPF
jgi:hypothetical protein